MNHIKKVKLMVLLFALCSSFANAQNDKHIESVLRKVADRIVAQTSYQFVNTKTGQTYDNLKNVPFSLDVKVKTDYNDWHYTNGVLDIAMLELANKINDQQYQKYVQQNMDFDFNPDNLNYFKKQYNEVLGQENGIEKVSKQSMYMFFRMIRLDDYGTMAASLVDLYEKDKNPLYKVYFDKAAHELMYAEPRLKDGTIARYDPHQMTIWADDLYMSVSLLARMGKLTGDHKYFDDAAHQVIQFHHYLWDATKQIYYHCYYTDDKENGVAYWGRCNGWIMMAQADLLSALPDNYPQRNKLIELFRQDVSGVARYQSNTGLWHQLLDKTDSYLETSCSAMFTYSIARGVNRGWLRPDFAQVAYYGWKGIESKITADGDVTSICPGTGIAPSIVAYYNRPERQNLAMGEGPVLRAGAEMIGLKPYREQPASSFYHLIKDRSK